MLKDMKVNKFKIGDRIVLYGWRGTVIAIRTEVREYGQCTYLQVAFDEPDKVGQQYNNGWYGGLNDFVAYGYIGK